MFKINPKIKLWLPIPRAPMAAFMMVSVAVTTATGWSEPRKVATTIKNPSKKEIKKKRIPDKRNIIVSGSDSLYWTANVLFLGFDKQLNTSVESFHVKNLSDRAIRDFTIEITYTDLSGRMLHRRKEKITTEIPSLETRKIDLKSFDTQHSFFYRLSNPPSRQATPFDVSIRLLSLHVGN